MIMRHVVLALLLAACTEHGKGGGAACVFMGDAHVPGEQFPAGDGCNFCECLVVDGVGEVSCTEQVCTGACGATGACLEGPACGGGCCAAGEACVDEVCTCNGQPSCTDGEICAVAGPVGETCGFTCCGSTSNPCPL